jgi:DNA-binding transcriptional regulator GbsR (MarR family)
MKRNLVLLALLTVSTAWSAEETVKATELTPSTSGAENAKKEVRKQKRAAKRAKRKANSQKRVEHAIQKMEEVQTLINSGQSAEQKIDAIKGKIAAALEHLKKRQSKIQSGSDE